MILPPACPGLRVGIGDTDRPDLVDLPRDPFDLAKIDAERVVIDPAKLWIFVIEPIVFDQFRRFIIASKLQHDGVIDNRSETLQALIYSSRHRPAHWWRCGLSRASSHPDPAGSIANMTRKGTVRRNSHTIAPSAMNRAAKRTIQPLSFRFPITRVGILPTALDPGPPPAPVFVPVGRI